MPNWKGYVEIPFVRKLFIVPIAENNHGKSLIIRSLVRLAGSSVTGWKRQGYDFDGIQRTTNLGPCLSLFITGDATPRTGKGNLGQQHGYDMVVVSFTKNERLISAAHRDCLGRSWDERWTLRNPRITKFLVEDKRLGPLTARASTQIDALAGHLWTRIQRTMFP